MILKETYLSDGYKAEYVKHQGNIYIYQRTPYKWGSGSLMTKEEISEQHHHYEVVIPRKSNLPPKDRAAGKKGYVWTYPRSSDWGQYGTVKTLERAEEKMAELLARGL